MGYRDAFLSDSERQAVFDNDMKPLLADGDLDGGLLAGIRDIDANATPEHAAALEHGRQINALLTAGSLLLGLVLVLVAVAYWLRHGRDPVYIDDRSILMPAPPADLTPAMATVLLADRCSDRTVTAGLVDLAARGSIAFVAEGKHHDGTRTGIKYLGKGQDGLPAPEKALRDSIDARSAHHGGYLGSHILYRLIGGFDTFKDDVETAAVKRGWLTAKPSQVTFRWGGIGGIEVAAAILVGFMWLMIAVSWLFVAMVGLAVAGLATLVLARYMPSRTRQGAMLWAMLSAYRRTLQATLAQAGSMGDVVTARALPWVRTPDQVMAWGVAFGLDGELEAVLSRSVADAEQAEDAATQPAAWRPSWWLAGPTGAHSSHAASGPAASGHAAAGSSGLFSASALPDPGSIMAALGSLASPASPASSSSSSGGSSFSSGGSFGGGGGGGGGGAGGGF